MTGDGPTVIVLLSVVAAVMIVTTGGAGTALTAVAAIVQPLLLLDAPRAPFGGPTNVTVPLAPGASVGKFHSAAPLTSAPPSNAATNAELAWMTLRIFTAGAVEPPLFEYAIVYVTCDVFGTDAADAVSAMLRIGGATMVIGGSVVV